MRIYLRPVTLEDSSMIIKWRNTPKVNSYCFDKTLLTEEKNKAFFKNYIESGKYKQFIVERIDEDLGVFSYPIATVYLKDIDNINKRCQLCVFTSDDQEWNTESQSIAIKLLVEKAFKEYKMHKVYSLVYSQNEDEVKLLKNSGFVEECILRKEAIDGNGEYSDIVRLAVFNG